MQQLARVFHQTQTQNHFAAASWQSLSCGFALKSFLLISDHSGCVNQKLLWQNHMYVQMLFANFVAFKINQSTAENALSHWIYTWLYADFWCMLISITVFAKAQKLASFVAGGQGHQTQNCLHTVSHAPLPLGQLCNLIASISWNLNQYAASRLAAKTRPHTGFYSELCVPNIRERFIERTTSYAQWTALATEESLQLRLNECVRCGEYRGVCGRGPWQGCPHRSPGQRKLPSCLPRPPHGTAHWLSMPHVPLCLILVPIVTSCCDWVSLPVDNS